ncbi:MAG: hypothetical protein LBD06_06095 [Candidatus Accumulibacter sp.]|jgi:hypothetical protein|nr:hypothetical protein [Accumulibacter sp.]
MKYRIEADFPLQSDWLPAKVFSRHHDSVSAAKAIAIEGVDEPGEGEARVICVETGEVVWRSTDEEYE